MRKNAESGTVISANIIDLLSKSFTKSHNSKNAELFAENPRLARATKDLDKATKSLAKELKKSGIKSFDKRKLIRKPY